MLEKIVTGEGGKRFSQSALCFGFLLLFYALIASGTASSDDSWIKNIRTDHPRLFFNTETWPKVKERALNQEKEWYAELKERVDGYPDEPTPESRRESNASRLRPDGTIETVSLPKPREWGTESGHTAFVYLVTGNRKYLDKTVKMLEVSVSAYLECIEKGMAVDWYSTSRVHWLAAYDWIYNDLSPEKRRALMNAFLEHIDSLQPRPERPPIHRLNDSDHTTGFYGVRNLLWFTGLTAYGDGIDDDMALDFLRLGYRYNQDLFEFRKRCAGDDGGLASATQTYSLGEYPWSQFNFIYTWRSATGEDIAADWPHLAYFPVWIIWNWLPGPYPRGFGSGDVNHFDNALQLAHIYTHMSQIMDFYGMSYPDCAALAAYIREIVPESRRRYNRAWAFYPFLMTNLEKAPSPQKPEDTDLYARHFETLGQVFMRSGTGPDDTYSLFTIGSQAPSHKQFDENNFIIYKKGYLALDSGTRGWSTSYQLRHYYSQTVAHNCILIHKPDEPFPDYWGPAYDGKEGRINHGGMYKAKDVEYNYNSKNGSCIAFETNNYYTYIAGDATSCYLPEKCGLALRQYVFVYPDYFVICDRVTATNAGYKKDWLLHSQNEPLMDGSQFRVDHEEGRLFCRTLYPEDAVLTKVGGPGKEFRAAGKNWELAPEVAERLKERYNGGLLGNWRVEVSPGTPRKDDIFLHLIQVGDTTLEKMDTAALVEENGMVGVRFFAEDKIVLVKFAASGEPAGHIMIVSGARIFVDRDLTGEVMPQAGLSGGN